MQILFDDPDMQEIFEGFVVETNELLDALQQDLMALEDQPENYDLLNSIFRNFHTIKGTSGFMGFDDIAGITHHAEDLLNKFRKQELQVTIQCIDVLLDVWDIISKMLYNKTEGIDEDVPSDLTVEKLELLNKGEEIPSNFRMSVEANQEASEVVETDSAEEQYEVSNGSNAVEESSENENTLDSILGDSSFGDHDGYYTDDELDLIQQAFAQINEDHKKEASERRDDGILEVEMTEEVEDLFSSQFDEHLEMSTESVSKSEEVIEEHTVPKEKAEVVKEQVEITKEDKKSEGKKVDTEKTKTNNSVKSSKKSEGKKVTPTKKTVTKSAETIRIDVSRVETLMDLSGELVLGRNRLSQISELLERDTTNYEQNVRDLMEAMGSIDLLTSEIQSAVMKMRMVPIAKLYQKAPRIVRDLAKENNKKMKLVVTGEETEIDRGIIEELNDPLTHMIRNSCDHGIESKENRLAAGKPEEGIISLDADQEGNHIVLKISDDGSGMDPEKLKTKAIEKDLITKEQADQMSDKEAYQLIFAPGFSTAKQVTSVSGRGVGMDVVRTNIQKLKGIIEIESELGKGTTFIIKLPLTLAIIQGLLVKVNQEIFAIPLNSVTEVVSIEDGDVSKVNNKEVIRIREEVLPVLYLNKILKISNVEEISNIKEKYVVNVSVGMQSMGLVVDQLIGQEEIVIKSLGNYLGNIKGIAGSTILGDGRPIMILDVAQLLELVYENDYSTVL